jgi:tetratricopeptide (TPR) repeat protein
MRRVSVLSGGDDGMTGGLRTIGWALAIGLTAAPALAVGPDTSPLDTHPSYVNAVDLIRRGDYAAAIRSLAIVRAEHPDSADVYNWLGFAHRKLKDYPTAKIFYDRALAIDPAHLGANEYLGEWYVETGDLARARERLTRLVALCGDCEEKRDLEAAIARAP